MKIQSKILAIISIFILMNHTSKADMGFEFLGGLSTPSDKISDVYNSSLKLQDITKQYIMSSANLGYHIGAKIRIPISDNFMFTGGAIWNKFPQSDLQILVPKNVGTGFDTLKLATTTNIIPLNVGVNVYLLRNVIGIYASGDITYNIIQNTVDYNLNGITLPLNLELSTNPLNTRVGAAIGAGLDLNVGLVTLNLEGKYHYSNMIGKIDNEPDKNYFTLTLGVVFGASK